ncbi:O-antigen translocase [Flavobacterium adhaerens]|uniref:O-antigen translocase n=1 Tax=Flavobacterium adhaerens TaxID=3149043 RepID=UPI0032B4CB8F
MSSIKKIVQTDLFKISYLNGLSVLLKIGTGFIVSKLLAVFVGSSGMALVGNFRNFFSSLEGISSLGFSSGIVKYVGENENNKKELEKTISTILITFLVVTFFFSGLIFVFSNYLGNKIFGNYGQYTIVFKAVAIVLPWSVVSVLFTSIINGFGKYNKVIFINLITNLVCLMLSAVLIYYFTTIGAFVSIIIVPVVLVVVSCFYLPMEIQILKRLNFREFDFEILKRIGAFSLMIIPPTIISPIFNLQIRNFLIANVGLESSGYWEAITRVSNLYLLFIGTLMSVYFYPKIIRSKGEIQVKEVIWSFYKYILPVFILAMGIIYILKKVIVETLFTTDFLPVTDLFFWQLLGDVFKVAGMILGILLMARRNINHYIFIEITALIFLYFVSLFCIQEFGLQGVVIAQAIENLVYLLVLLLYFRKVLF